MEAPLKVIHGCVEICPGCPVRIVMRGAIPFDGAKVLEGSADGISFERKPANRPALVVVTALRNY
jgi:hypothetical protein